MKALVEEHKVAITGALVGLGAAIYFWRRNFLLVKESMTAKADDEKQKHEAKNSSLTGGDFWVFEQTDFECPGYTHGFKCSDLLYEEKTPYQTIKIYQSTHFGKLMLLDGVIQNSETDEFSYHEMISHVPLTVHPNPQRVLIIGGGDLGVVREVLKHQCVTAIHLVEIDQRVTEVSKKYFPELTTGCDDPRLMISYACGHEYLKDTENHNYYDVIIVDSSDPIGPNQVLFGEEFYSNVRKALRSGGIAVAQGETMFLHNKTIQRMLGVCRRNFEQVRYYYSLIPAYGSGQIGYIIMGRKDVKFNQPLPARAQTLAGARLKYWSEEVHRSAFVLPRFFDAERSLLDTCPENPQNR